jgi:hypothetical protein
LVVEKANRSAETGAEMGDDPDLSGYFDDDDDPA